MAQAHAQLIADLNDRPFDAATKRMDRSMESFALDAVREFEKVEQAAKASSAAMEQSFQKALASYNTMQDRMSRSPARKPDFRDQLMNDPRAGMDSKGGGKGGSGIYRAGQVGLQLQDISVQMQAGTKASTILLQQGTQLASIFGPTGAIIGGVSGIVAMVGAWAIGLDKVIAREEKLAKEAVKRAALMKDIFGGAADAEKDALHSTRRRLFGDEEADQIKRAEDHQERLQKIQNSRLPGLDVAIEAENKRFQEAEKLIEHNKQKAVDAEHEKEKAAIAGMKRINDSLKAQANNESPADMTMRLARDVTDIIAERDKLSGAEWLQKDNEALGVMAELAKTARGETEKHIKAQEDQAKKFEDSLDGAKKAYENLKDAVQKSIMSVWGEFDKAARNSINNADALMQARSVTRGNQILQNAQNIMDPQAAKDRARAARKEDRAIRSAIKREVEQEDAAERNRGGFGMTKEQREARIRGKMADVDAARRRNDKVSIDEADIQKLAAQIANENAKLIAK